MIVSLTRAAPVKLFGLMSRQSRLKAGTRPRFPGGTVYVGDVLIEVNVILSDKGCPVRVKNRCGRQADGTAGLPPAPEMPVRSGTYASCQ
jgi:hypothetical protein